jgi:serine/threonine protein kinase
MEYCAGGCLHDWLHKNVKIPLTWKQRTKMITDIATGLNFLHTADPPIIHRDLKSLK